MVQRAGVMDLHHSWNGFVGEIGVQEGSGVPVLVAANDGGVGVSVRVVGQEEDASSTALAATQNAVTTQEPRTAVQRKMEENDSFGVGVTLVSMFVVLVSLAVLNLIFGWVGKLSVARAARMEQRAASGTPTPAGLKGGKAGSDAAIAAISMALHEYREEARDQESLYITIREVQRRYSPWNSKIYGVMQSREWARMRHGGK